MKQFPLFNWKGNIPTGKHPGAFGATRKHDVHTGVDLYVPDNELVIAIESGIVVAIEDFTGPKANTPWWNDTKAVLIEGESGVVCYGEILPMGIYTGEMVCRGQCIGFVKNVLPATKIRKDIVGHSNYMLHFELYKTGTRETVFWNLNQDKPEELLDPTNLLTKIYKDNNISSDEENKDNNKFSKRFKNMFFFKYLRKYLHLFRKQRRNSLSYIAHL